jgi:hypothetical protein
MQSYLDGHGKLAIVSKARSRMKSPMTSKGGQSG